MKRFILAITTIVCSFWSSITFAQEPTTFFPYPSIPEEKTLLSERCNFFVDHFWERCNLKQSFSSPHKLNQAFGDWVALMPYATSDTVYMAVDRFISDVANTGADNLLQIGIIAQNWLYSDTAQYQSEELYLPFCKAVAENKKVSKAQKSKFEAQLKILENSSVGCVAPDFQYIKEDGSKGNFKDILASRIILFFNDPECIDCSITKARLAADYYLSQLIDKGLVKVVAIYPGEVNEEWKSSVESMPENWEIGASPDIDMLFDIPSTPDIYYLDSRHKIMGKHLVVDNLLSGLQQIYKQMQN